MPTVYFTNLRTTPNRSLLDKIDDLLNRTIVRTIIKKDDLVAIKLHFGEHGNTAYLRPLFLRTIIEKIKTLSCQPFLTDTNTLYSVPPYHCWWSQGSKRGKNSYPRGDSPGGRCCARDC